MVIKIIFIIDYTKFFINVHLPNLEFEDLMFNRLINFAIIIA
jgi:hypothetical protein